MGSSCCGKTDSQPPQERFQLRRVGNFTFNQHSNYHSVYKSAGTGCRQTAAWFTDATHEEVEQKRAEFWDTRVQGDASNWLILRSACEAPDAGELQTATAEALVKAGGLNMPQGYLLQCYDAHGFKYDLPPFVVNEPTSYGERKKEVIIPTSPGRPLSLVVRSSRRPDIPLKMTSNNTGKQLKVAYQIQVKIQGSLRLFFNGKELKDDGLLSPLEDGVVVQAMG